MHTLEIQAMLTALGYSPGPIDGILADQTTDAIKAFQKRQGLVVDGIVGPKTEAALRAAAVPVSTPKPSGAITPAMLWEIAPTAASAIVGGIVDNQALITDAAINTPLRLAHFLAQLAHESDGFRTTGEYWGPTEAQKRYEGRADLGNTQHGDGKRFRGRGLIQITGRANARAAGQALSQPYEYQPELMEQFPHALAVSVWFWTAHKLNAVADRDDVVAITRKINGGRTGLAQRKAYLARAKAALGV